MAELLCTGQIDDGSKVAGAKPDFAQPVVNWGAAALSWDSGDAYFSFRLNYEISRVELRFAAAIGCPSRLVTPAAYVPIVS